MYYGRENFNSNSSLQHWKYIKRVRVNGKWKYYYDADQLKKDLGVTARKEANRAHDKAMLTDSAYKLSTDNLKAAQENAKKNVKTKIIATYKKKGGKNELTSIKSTKEVSPEARRKLAYAERDAYQWRQQAEKAKQAYYEKQSAYHKTPLGKLSKFVNKAKTKVEKILGKDIWQDNEDFKVMREGY